MNQEIRNKECYTCHTIKPLTEFHKDNSRYDGYRKICKICRNLTMKDSYIRNKIKIKKRSYEYRINNREYYKNISKQWRLKNQQKSRHSSKQWRLHNKNRIKTYYYNYAKIRHSQDIAFKLVNNLRVRMRMALKTNQKSGHTINLLMCTVDEWRKHLESLWTEGMSWNNYGNKEGQWSIDHIIPCDFFKDYLDDPVEQYMCFRWQNTRPMWHIDNLIKKNKLLTY